MKRSVFFLFFFIAIYLQAQQIKHVDFKVVGTLIEVTYDAVACSGKTFDVEIVFQDVLGKVYHPKSLTGDFKNVNCGEGKKINWDVLKDHENINSDLQVQLKVVSSDDLSVVKLGSHSWSMVNLNTEKFRNGDLIPEARTLADWKKAGENKQAVWCCFNNDATSCTKYGKLYNWYAVSDPRGLAPQGWHVASDEEWTELILVFGGQEIAGKAMKEKRADAKSEKDVFAGELFGYRNMDGKFYDSGQRLYWWSRTEQDTKLGWCRGLGNKQDNVSRIAFSKNFGFSVRCVKD